MQPRPEVNDEDMSDDSDKQGDDKPGDDKQGDDKQGDDSDKQGDDSDKQGDDSDKQGDDSGFQVPLAQRLWGEAFATSVQYGASTHFAILSNIASLRRAFIFVSIGVQPFTILISFTRVDEA